MKNTKAESIEIEKVDLFLNFQPIMYFNYDCLAAINLYI